MQLSVASVGIKLLYVQFIARRIVGKARMRVQCQAISRFYGRCSNSTAIFTSALRGAPFQWVSTVPRPRHPRRSGPAGVWVGDGIGNSDTDKLASFSLRVPSCSTSLWVRGSGVPPSQFVTIRSPVVFPPNNRACNWEIVRRLRSAEILHLVGVMQIDVGVTPGKTIHAQSPGGGHCFRRPCALTCELQRTAAQISSSGNAGNM